ncbi:MAG: hypothetical protein ACE5HU_10720, partial [Acidobacteriota bacterium]
LDRRLGLYSQAMEAGQRALAEESLRAGVGNLWGRLEARPYMRARAGYAGCLEALGRREEAVDHWQDLLRLNLNDNQALRYRLIPALLELGRDEEALRLLERFDDEGSAIIRYCRALLEFRRAGDAPSARGRLANALQANAHVPKYLLGRKTIPPRLPEVFSYGGEDEAVLCVLEIRDAWKRSRGALTWLGRFLRRPRKAPRRNPRTDRHPG